jgi:hypothetical protein
LAELHPQDFVCRQDGLAVVRCGVCKADLVFVLKLLKVATEDFKRPGFCAILKAGDQVNVFYMAGRVEDEYAPLDIDKWKSTHLSMQFERWKLLHRIRHP